MNGGRADFKMAAVYDVFDTSIDLERTRTEILATAAVLRWQLVDQNDSVIVLRNPRHPWKEGTLELTLAPTVTGTRINTRMHALKFANYEPFLNEMMASFIDGLAAKLQGKLPHLPPGG